MMQPPDFDIKLNMLWYFVPTQSNGWNYLKLVSDNEPAFRGKNTPTTTPAVKGGLEDWARRFCSESSSQKTYATLPSSSSLLFSLFGFILIFSFYFPY